MNVLVVGSGGREHALCWALAPRRCAAGCSARRATPASPNWPSASMSPPRTSTGSSRWRAAKRIDFVVVGPEAPLVGGAGRPTRRGRHPRLRADRAGRRDRRLEGVHEGAVRALRRSDGALRPLRRAGRRPRTFIRRHGAPLVVKADGLAAGKGVIVCHNENEAYAAIDHIMIESAFGDAGAQVVIEDFLVGEEASFFALVHGDRAVPLASAQDHKPAFDGDQGPNTGGMGAYSPAPIITEAVAEEIMAKIVLPVVRGLAEDGRPYSGVLYAGLMFTARGHQGAGVQRPLRRSGMPAADPAPEVRSAGGTRRLRRGADRRHPAGVARRSGAGRRHGDARLSRPLRPRLGHPRPGGRRATFRG